MFKKLLFTDNCVLNTSTNTVIFDFEDQWKEYLDWKENNPVEANKINLDKQAELNWNQGAVHKNGTEHRVFHKSGHLFDYKKYNVEGSLVIHNKYFYNGNPMYTFRKRGYVTIEEIFVDTGGKGSTITSKIYKNNDKERKVLKYYTAPNTIQTSVKRLSIESQLFNEFYDNGCLRAEGLLDMKNRMTGKWIFYSRDNIIESSHTFKEGSLIEISYLYNQMGEKTKSIYHG